MRLRDKTAIVTGGGQGIGEGVARAYAAEGARVAILDINLPAAEAMAQAIGGGAFAVACDIADSGGVDAAFEQVMTRFERLDIVAHVAAIKPVSNLGHLLAISSAQQRERDTTGSVSTFLDSVLNMDNETWQRQIDVDLTGTFYCNRAALRVMAPQRKGCIINTASNTAITGMVGIANYVAAKAGVLGFSRSLAREVISQGIRVNIVAPGGTDTPMPTAAVDKIKTEAAKRQPIGRLGSIAEMAAAYVFLASDESSFIVGETMNVNGGLHTL